ncbi:hypothetical protein ADUPG1_005682, partial [Aduncisulcus paluster]
IQPRRRFRPRPPDGTGAGCGACIGGWICIGAAGPEGAVICDEICIRFAGAQLPCEFGIAATGTP